ncbi:acyl-CoA dehydrogenase family protein [Pseudomonas aeruginosa]|nr:acyl-CoA dehydrogenase family protein [Pseudomonas aeruginosa]
MSELEKNAADPYRQPLPRTPARRIADDAEAIRVARELAGLFAEEASLRDRQRRLPVAELEAFSQSGLWGISVPRAYGGAEVGYRTLAEVLKTIAAVDPSLAQLPQNHLAVLDHLRLDGSEEQKRFFYGLVLDGVRSTLEELNLDRHWRNARTHTLHDPVRWKYHAIGNYQLNGVKPPRHAWL